MLHILQIFHLLVFTAVCGFHYKDVSIEVIFTQLFCAKAPMSTYIYIVNILVYDTQGVHI